MSYSTDKIRNVCLLGHGGNGKTSLAESMLFLTGGTDRLGKTPDGNTVCDYDPEEVKRQISISMASAPVKYRDHKLNVLDTPGNFDFNGEVCSALYAADTGIMVCAAKDGLSVGADRAWKMLRERNMPRIIYISRCDEENADFSSTVAALKDKFGTAVTPIVFPIMDGTSVGGFVDLLHKKAYDAKGEIPIPGDVADDVQAAYEELMEAAAGVDEELMEKYFDAGELTADEIIKGLKEGVKSAASYRFMAQLVSKAFDEDLRKERENRANATENAVDDESIRPSALDEQRRKNASEPVDESLGKALKPNARAVDAEEEEVLGEGDVEHREHQQQENRDAEDRVRHHLIDLI